MMHKAWCSIEEVPYCFPRSSIKFQGHKGQKIAEFDRNWAFPECNFCLNSLMDFKWYTKLDVVKKRCPIIFSCDQAALWMGLSVRPSVCHTFLTMFPSSYHHEIFGSYYQWQKWRPCKRSRSEVKGQGHRGHNPTLPFPDCNSSSNSLMMMKWCI